MSNIYDELNDAGCTLDNHESDLYVLRDATSEGILSHHPDVHKAPFRGTDGREWWEIPFAHTPWWTTHTKAN